MIDAPVEVEALLASRPKEQFIANLFTFALNTGDTYRFTDSPRPITIGGNTYLASKTKVMRGKGKLTRGLSVDSQQIQINEVNGTYLERAMLGYFNLATYTLSRVFAASAISPWVGPVVKFIGQIGSVDEIGLTYAKMTAKSMLNVLDNDFPRILLQKDCPHVLFDAACGLVRATYLVQGTCAGGCTANTILSSLTAQADGYFTQGVVTFTSGALSGISYMVKNYTQAGGTLYPAYPLLTAPAAGDTFQVSPGCDKTLATCQAKWNYDGESGAAPYFGGFPFIPDPTTIY